VGALRVKIKLPSNIKDLPQRQRVKIADELMKALDVAVPAKTTPDKEHNVWSRNDEPFLAQAEEELYELLVSSASNNMATLIAGLGLSNEAINISKAYSNDFKEYEDQLIKGKGKLPKLSELWELAKTKKQDFLKYIQGGSNWTKQKLRQVDLILKQQLPDYAKVAEEYAVRSAFIAKVRNTVDTEALEALGAYVDRFPKTIVASQKDSIVLTARESLYRPHVNTSIVVTEAELDADRARRTSNPTPQAYTILPLQPQEIRTVQNAEIRTADKLQEIAERHRKSVKQLVLQAINGRWSAQQLAQALFDNFADQNSDWRRVAITELAMASSDAFLAGCADGDTVWVQPVEGSCKHCKAYLEGRSFIVTSDPKLMGNDHAQEMQYVWVGKSNFGRTLASWLPCIPLHPNCRHRYQKVSRFYNTDAVGKPTLKPVNQLIQEERARRGLQPDPRLV
jgi:hypothetical protein